MATIGYLVWRALGTLNPEALWLAVPMWLLEVHAAVAFLLFALTTWDTTAVPPATPRHRTDLRVAVLIATYNEPVEVLLPTIAAARRLRLATEVWVLDDGGREHVRELAERLGARYLARSEHTHAKAGNINHALGVVDADVVVLLDADHVARPNLLANTIGYFDDPEVALVQLPQDFYNTDSFEHLPAGRVRTAVHRVLHFGTPRDYSEQGLFYRVLQPGRNRWNAAFCCGTNALLRTEALRAVGGLAVETITEDIHTALKLHRRGYRSVYHNEVLARGLAAADAPQYLQQRQRWGTGAMQVLRRDNPLLGPGLTLAQRLSYLASLAGWLDSWRLLGQMLVPVMVIATAAAPVRAPFHTFLIAFAATLALQWTTTLVLSGRYGSIGRTLVFELIRLPAGLLATLTLVTNREAPFRVTGKGRQGDLRRRARPTGLHLALMALLGGALVLQATRLVGAASGPGGTDVITNAAALWTAVHLVALMAAVRRITSPTFATERRGAVRLPLPTNEAPGRERVEADISLTGARLPCGNHRLPAHLHGVEVVVHAPDVSPDPIRLQAVMGRTRPVDGFVTVRFHDDQPEEQAALAAAIYSHPDGACITAIELTASSSGREWVTVA